ncbi:hypothetical protein [Saccharopolyspora elongata]|uniref:Uncharacterized protein n=1 Tax=Saccharopolyspora elongata TaxID=2530387 RepID=A0A4R4Z216_9PSEU|nr:hypothetical protein [Saccharopolyspora elongata]TDD51975.1 hypothetical protein E1288_13435 [Saccharopolyspora elongata]
MTVHRPYWEHVPVPDDVARRIRSGAVRFGAGSLVLSLVEGIAILVLGFGLPTAHHPISGIAVMFGGISAFFHFFSSITVFSGRSYVKNGQLNKTAAGKACRLLAVFWGGTIATSLGSCGLLAMVIRSSGRSSVLPEVQYTPAIIGYLLLLLVPCVLSAVNFFIGRHLLRPAA